MKDCVGFRTVVDVLEKKKYLDPIGIQTMTLKPAVYLL
jgi:hypothetical protein